MRESIVFPVRPHKLVGRLFVALIIAELLIIGADLWLNYAQGLDSRFLRRIVNITREDSFGAFLSVQLAVAGSLLAALNACLCRARCGGTRGSLAGWSMVTLILGYLAIDDAVALHERVGSTIRDMQAGAVYDRLQRLVSGYVSYPWQAIFGPFVLLALLALLVFLWHEVREPKGRLALLASLAMVVVALQLDFFEGIEGCHAAVAAQLGLRTYTVRHFSKVLEESLEMLALIFLVVIFLNQLMTRSRSITVAFKHGTSGTPSRFDERTRGELDRDVAD